MEYRAHRHRKAGNTPAAAKGYLGDPFWRCLVVVDWNAPSGFSPRQMMFSGFCEKERVVSSASKSSIHPNEREKGKR